MITLLTIVHVLIAILLILIVLLQSGKGSDLGSVFGGGASQTLFGAAGSKTILTKITTVLAVLFMLTSFVLATMPASKGKSALQKELEKETTSTQKETAIPNATTGDIQETKTGPEEKLPAIINQPPSKPEIEQPSGAKSPK